MRTLVFLLALIIVGTLVNAAQGPTQASIKIGLISPKKILAEAKDARADMERFRSFQQERAAAVRAKQQAWERTRQELARATDAAAKAQLAQREQQERRDFESTTSQVQIELQQRQQQVQSELQTRVKPVIEELMRGRDMDLVLNSDTTVIWARPTLDLTPVVIERLNASSTAAPAAPPKR